MLSSAKCNRALRLNDRRGFLLHGSKRWFIFFFSSLPQMYFKENIASSVVHFVSANLNKGAIKLRNAVVSENQLREKAASDD